MRISDWSSDVCSSDLAGVCFLGKHAEQENQDCGQEEASQQRCIKVDAADRPDTVFPIKAFARQAGKVGAKKVGQGGHVDQQYAGARGQQQGVFFARLLCLGDKGAVKKVRSEEHTSELQSLMRISYAVFCLNKKKHKL